MIHAITWMNPEDAKKGSHKRINTVCFHFYEVLKNSQIQRQRVEWWLPGAGRREIEELVFNEYGVSVWEDEQVLEIDGDIVCTTM